MFAKQQRQVYQESQIDAEKGKEEPNGLSQCANIQGSSPPQNEYEGLHPRACPKRGIADLIQPLTPNSNVSENHTSLIPLTSVLPMDSVVT